MTAADPTNAKDASAAGVPPEEPAEGAPHDSPHDQPDPVASFKAAASNLGEAGAYVLQYASVQVDRTITGVRNLALLIVLGVVAAVVGLSIAVTAAALLVIGLAQAIAAAISSTPGVGAAWPGNLIVGGVLTLFIVVGVWLLTKWIKSAGFASTVRKYEAMQDAQRRSFGRSAAERAQEAAEED